MAELQNGSMSKVTRKNGLASYMCMAIDERSFYHLDVLVKSIEGSVFALFLYILIWIWQMVASGMEREPLLYVEK